jgi:hypothetical protein
MDSEMLLRLARERWTVERTRPHGCCPPTVIEALLVALSLCGCWCLGGPPEERPCQRCKALAAIEEEELK